jgi:ribose-phosphate pyrophosphokinase
MKVIDSDDYAASGIETFFFPGGEPHARVPKDFGDSLLFLKARTWNDVGLALAVLDALQAGALAASKNDTKVWLFAAYFPGARQDRSDGQTPLTKALYWSMFDLVADRVFTFDMHSNPGQWGVKNYMLEDLVVSREEGPPNAYIICPDAGAMERAQRFAAASEIKTPIIQCEKHRDFSTGKFTHFTMPPLPGVGDYVIVDDICDGGGTFNLLADEFMKDPCGEASGLGLIVSHGIFSKGIDNIHPRIDFIMTTDSWYRGGDKYRVDVLPLQKVIDKIVEEANDA